MSDLKMHTANLVAKNIEKLTALFPNCVTEGRNEQGEIVKGVDFELLRQELSNVLIDGEQERYTLNWVGKKESILAANAPIAKTLRPCREESVNFDTTENLFIEGDNLDALKLLQENYLGKVKMIYIDPPYNTGNDFIYNDDFAENTEEFLIRSHQIDEEGNRLIANTESNGRFHSDWLSMMYSRLRLARNLLTDDGVIFISIDGNEQANLKRVCDEVFGERNFVEIFSWVKTSTPPSLSTKSRKTNEYIICYEKCKDNYQYNAVQQDEGDEPLLNSGNPERILEFPSDSLTFKFIENGILEAGKFDKVTLINNIKIVDFKSTTPVLLSGEFKWTQEKLNEEITKGTIFIAKTIKLSIRFLRSEKGFKRPTNFIKDQIITPVIDKKNHNVDTNEKATREILEIFGKTVFTNPKPVTLIKYLSNFKVSENDLILDFFGGSGTTAHAVMQLNAEDGGKRRFITVQIPEIIDPSKAIGDIAKKVSQNAIEFLDSINRPQNIAEISKERIRRAGAKIQAENPDKQIDIGFRVLKIDSSNMKDIYYQPEQLDKTMLDHMVSHIKEDRSAEDLLFQVMLDWGIELSLPIERKTIDGSEVYFVAGNTLVACFDKFTMNVVDEIAKVKPLRVVSTELAIMHDQDKTNIKERFKQLSPDTEVKFL